MKTLFFTITSLCLVTFANTQITAGLTASYSFDTGTANDDKGSNNGTVVGATLTQDRFGNANKAFNFNDGDYIALPDNAALKSPVMSVSLWVKVEGVGVSNVGTNYIYSVVNSTTNAYFAAFCMSAYTSNGNFLNVSQNGPSESVLGFSSNTNTSNWQHYVMSIDNDSIKMHIDGVLQWSLYKGFTTTYTADSVYVGVSGNSTYSGNLIGSVDDINVFDRVLTDAEVLAMFNAEDPMSAGLNENLQVKQTVSIYPNPASSDVTISVKEATTISILNVVGEEILRSRIQTSEIINVSNFEIGIYFVKDLTTGNISKFVKK